jgi:hypothetical protein
MTGPDPREVTLVLVDAAGRVTGELPPFEVAVPWWQDAAAVVAGARDRFGIDVTILRILGAGQPVPHGGPVTYLAEVAPGGTTEPGGSTGTGDTTGTGIAAGMGAAAGGRLRSNAVELRDDPRRHPYARPGGPAASLDWALAELRARDVTGVVPVQQRTWNLSAIWRLDHGVGDPYWLKHVPAFFAHEVAVLRFVAAGHRTLVPEVLAADGGRMLLAHVPGEDLYDAPPADCDAIATAFHSVAVRAAGHVDELLAAGVPDRRGPALAATIRRTAGGRAAADPPLAALLDGLVDRLAAVAACGLPDTLGHGDLHAGNVRGHLGGPYVVIDWGDSFVGHPAFDIVRLTGHMAGTDAAPVLAAWADRWRATVPGCDPERAVELMRPVTALRNASVYADFLANIEAAEHPYHAADVDDWLTVAIDMS